MAGQVTESLVRERKKCNFNVEELINLVDGGEKETKKRREVEEMVLSVKELWDEVSEEYLSHKERYENAVRKASILKKLMKEYVILKTSIEDLKPATTFNILNGVIKDVTPVLVHMGMFVPSIIGLTSPEQQAEWLPKALNMEWVGTYAQTEIGHGTNVKALETTATYDPDTEEFVLNSPTLTSYKWWPGGLGHTSNTCVLFAQLYIKGVKYGVHPFLVRLRDLDTHMPFPGVKVGEIGPKFGFNTANNGFLGFENYRIPRTNMLMKNAQVLKDGTYVKSKNEKLNYGTMTLLRVSIINDVAFFTAQAATIAVRYAAVRHQSQLKPGQPEPQIIDYVTQQHKLFIAIATAHAYRIVCNWLWNQYIQFRRDISQGIFDQLPEMHALSCCLKALSSVEGTKCVEQCRLACGGHGYMKSSNLGLLYTHSTATITYEGDYTVLQLQTARFLIKNWKLVTERKRVPETVTYLTGFFNNDNFRWDNSPEGLIKGFKAVAAGKTKAAYESIEKYQKLGNDYVDSWNQSSVQLVNASEAHSRAMMTEVFWKETQRIGVTLSPNLATAMKQLAEMYIVYWALEKSGELLLYTTLSKSDIVDLQRRYEDLLALIRPNVVGLVDGFGFRDEVLNSTLGAYDGRVYERLMEEALKSPLNAQPVNESFYKYIKPYVKSKM